MGYNETPLVNGINDMKLQNIKVQPKPQETIRSIEADASVCVRVGIIGCGYWGPNLMRNFHELSESKVVTICDLRPERLKYFAKRYPGIKLSTDPDAILSDPTLDAVVIATPISTHYPLARKALLRGKHVLIEKPFAASSQQGERLIRLAKRQKKILMVGHTFEYNPAVLKVTEFLRSEKLGKLHYIDSVRVNLGRHQSDGYNVMWDLAPHDLSIILQWVGEFPVRVSAWGRSFVQKGIEDVAFMRLEFPG
ncbi:MAG TPA: Gfo/Idh/MocA family oxidoreductase, partial [bacterium]|nr:Gfo/Idh/MocA family oxidoreductase [bacterium]